MTTGAPRHAMLMRTATGALTASLMMGGSVMAEDTLKLGWEWRAERALEQRVALRVTSVAKEKRRFFGLLDSPSLAGSLPDPMEVAGEVLHIDRNGPASAGDILGFRIPAMELGATGTGSRLAIGIIGDKVVCLSAAPDDVTDADLPAWLPDAPCD